MSDREVEPLRCPFCEAPQSKIPKSGTLEVKCEYCGGVFSIASMQVQKVARCENHPDREATGTCSDCGGRFCDECLTDYELKARGESAVLHLCQSCLRNRYADRGNREIYSSGILFVFGIIMSFVAASDSSDPGLWLIVVLFFVLGIGLMIHGLYERKGVDIQILPPSDDSTF